MSYFCPLCFISPQVQGSEVSKDRSRPLRNYVCSHLAIWGTSLNITHFQRGTLYATEHPICTEARTPRIWYDEAAGGRGRRERALGRSCWHRELLREAADRKLSEASAMNLPREEKKPSGMDCSRGRVLDRPSVLNCPATRPCHLPRAKTRDAVCVGTVSAQLWTHTWRSACPHSCCLTGPCLCTTVCTCMCPCAPLCARPGGGMARPGFPSPGIC